MTSGVAACKHRDANDPLIFLFYCIVYFLKFQEHRVQIQQPNIRILLKGDTFNLNPNTAFK